MFLFRTAGVREERNISNDQRQSLTLISLCQAKSRTCFKSEIVPLPGPDTKLELLNSGETVPFVCNHQRFTFPPWSCIWSITSAKVLKSVTPGPMSSAKLTHAKFAPLRNSCWWLYVIRFGWGKTELEKIKIRIKGNILYFIFISLNISSVLRKHLFQL